MYVQRLIDARDKQKLTNQHVADLSNVPLTTVTRVFNRSTPNPGIETYAPLADALGVSLNDNPLNERIESTLTTYEHMLKAKDEHIAELREERKSEHREKIILAIFTAAIVFIVLLILFVDITNGNFGYFRY